MSVLHAVAGHEAVRTSLARAHVARRLPAALLFHGLRGIGKQRLALWTAQLMLCEAPAADGPCGACRSCRMALALEHPDLHWYFPIPRPKGLSGDRLADAMEMARIEALSDLRAEPVHASQGDELRGLYLGLIQGVRRRAHMRPSVGAVQVFVIADAEYLVPQGASTEAANALLKLLEEPPGGTRFILTSSEPGRLLPTIRSRSVPVHLAPLPTPQVAGFLMSHAGVDERTAAWAAGLGQGSIGRALGFLPESEGTPGPLEALRREALGIVEAALAAERSSAFGLALSYSSSRARSLVEMLSFVEDWLRDVAAVASGVEDRVISKDAIPRLRQLADSGGLDPSALAAALPALEEARELSRGNVNPQLVVSRLVRRLRRTLRSPAPAARAVP